MLKFLKKQKQQQENFASPSRRYTAYMIDNIILLLTKYITFLFIWFTWLKDSTTLFLKELHLSVSKGLINNAPHEVFFFFSRHPLFNEVIFILFCLFAIGSLYYILLTSSKHQATIGKRLMKICVVNKDNQRLSLSLSIYRYVVGLIPWIFHIIVIKSFIMQEYVFLLIMVMITAFWYETSIFGKSKRSVHDIICGTKVVNNIHK